jgi:hypothetical protein
MSKKKKGPSRTSKNMSKEAYERGLELHPISHMPAKKTMKKKPMQEALSSTL